jgi:chaperonin GroES
MNFQPLGDRVLVERVEETNTTASGIIIPDNAKEKPSHAKVVAVANEVKDVKLNDIVVFGKYVGSELTLEGKDYLVLNTEDILGVIA